MRSCSRVNAALFVGTAMALGGLAVVPSAAESPTQFAGKALPPNRWVKLEAGDPVRNGIAPVAHVPNPGRFLVLGGRLEPSVYEKGGCPYDVLLLDPETGRWENWLPAGKEWGARFGPCKAPGWKTPYWMTEDREGNARPNWTAYMVYFAEGPLHDWDPEGRRFVLYLNGSTLAYDPETREWEDLAPTEHPAKRYPGVHTWGSMCYDAERRQFVLFGGGNVQSERGDYGTWTYDPKANSWTELTLGTQPPPRANSRLVFDRAARKVVLFGGDQLDQLIADTWTFDGREWKELKPPVSPSPRAGHAMLWLPERGRVLLLGGYGYESGPGWGSLYSRKPLEAWTFDSAAGSWEFLKTWGENEGPANCYNTSLPAAVGDGDVVLVQSNGTWLCRLDAAESDPKGTAQYGVAPGATIRRTGPHDPEWYRTDVPVPDPAGVAADLLGLAANTWAQRPTPKLAAPASSWGSAVFDPAHDVIIRFSGGHSAYCGTAPWVYDVKTDRWSLPFAPQYPTTAVGTNDAMPGEWSFGGNPWMTGHTYRSTGYEPNAKGMLFVAHGYAYLFDPETGRWTRSPAPSPFRPNGYVNTVCATPRGAVVWADAKWQAGLWRLNVADWTWEELPVKGKLPEKSADCHGMCYDSNRDRLLLFSKRGEPGGDVVAYDMKSGVAEAQDAAGKELMADVPARETAYLPEQDMVLVGTAYKDAAGKWAWHVYDCATNEWKSAEVGGAEGILETNICDLGLIYDPERKLVWALDRINRVYVMRFDPREAGLKPLKRP